MCDNDFKAVDWPSVFCRQLNMGNAKKALYTSKAGLKQAIGPINFMSPFCSPKTAKSMGKCGSQKQKCGHEEDVYIICAGGSGEPVITNRCHFRLICHIIYCILDHQVSHLYINSDVLYKVFFIGYT